MNSSRDFASEELDAVDAAILGDLADIFRATDPVPAGLVDDIKFALTVQALHAEVAELQRMGAESVLVRSEYTKTQTLTFSAERLSVMVTLSPVSERAVRIDGWITGHEGELTIEVRGPNDATTAARPTRRAGSPWRAYLEGLVRFVFLPAADAEARPVITPLVEI